MLAHHCADLDSLILLLSPFVQRDSPVSPDSRRLTHALSGEVSSSSSCSDGSSVISSVGSSAVGSDKSTCSPSTNPYCFASLAISAAYFAGLVMYGATAFAKSRRFFDRSPFFHWLRTLRIPLSITSSTTPSKERC